MKGELYIRLFDLKTWHMVRHASQFTAYTKCGRRERREAREYLDGPGVYKRLAKLAAEDWLKEEVLLEAEE